MARMRSLVSEWLRSEALAAGALAPVFGTEIPG